jgi:hypothetical protein
MTISADQTDLFATTSDAPATRPAPTARSTAAEHLAWVEGIARAPLYADHQEKLRQRHDRIVDRLGDPNLHIGVFGEFSSGKSTLLNALLGARLLPSSAVVTTSLETVLRRSEVDEMAVVPASSSEETWRFGTLPFTNFYKHAFGETPPGDVRTVLQRLIRTPDVAARLARVELGVAGTLLGDNVMLSDTPGFDSGEGGDRGHGAIAAAVGSRVDLAVVLVSADRPGSMTLAAFIADVLADLRDRSVFVLTKSRLVDPAQRDDVEVWVRSWLVEHGFTDPTLLRADATDIAVAALDAVSVELSGPTAQVRRAGDSTASGAGTTWHVDAESAVAEARALAAELERLAREGRHRFVEASVTALLDRLLEAVTTASETRRTELEDRRRTLDRVEIVDLDQFLGRWRRAVDADIDRVARQALATEATAPAPDHTLRQLRAAATAGLDNSDAIRKLVTTLTDATASVLKDWVGQRVDTACRTSVRALGEHADQLAHDFEMAYGELSRLAGEDPRPPEFDRSPRIASAAEVDLGRAFAAISAKGAELQTTVMWKTGGGLAAGAVIGTAVLPGVGTVVGAIVGAAMGSGRDKQKAQLRQAAEGMHDHCIGAAREGVRRAHADVADALRRSTDELVARYKNEVGPAIAALTAREEQRRAEVRADLRTIRATLDEAVRRRALLAAAGRPR